MGTLVHRGLKLRCPEFRAAELDSRIPTLLAGSCSAALGRGGRAGPDRGEDKECASGWGPKGGLTGPC